MRSFSLVKTPKELTSKNNNDDNNNNNNNRF